MARVGEVEQRSQDTPSRSSSSGATVDVHIHYSFEPVDDAGGRTNVTRRLVLDVAKPVLLPPLRRAITSAFDRENQRTMAAVKRIAEAHPEMDLV